MLGNFFFQAIFQDNIQHTQVPLDGLPEVIVFITFAGIEFQHLTHLFSRINEWNIKHNLKICPPVKFHSAERPLNKVTEIQIDKFLDNPK